MINHLNLQTDIIRISAKYIDTNWKLGVESEILVTPQNTGPFYRKKFDLK